MQWNRWYSLQSYIKSSLWIVPVVSLAIEVVLKRLIEQLGSWMVAQGWYDLKTGFLALEAAEAQAALERIFTINLSCLVFTFGSLLVAIQVAGGQYTPRIIATTLLRDNKIRYIIGLFVFTMLWAHRTLNQLSNADQVPQFQIFLATLLGVGSLVAFIVLIDYSAKLLRPVSLVANIGAKGIAVIKRVYPERTQLAQSSPEAVTKRKPPDRVVEHQGKSGIILAVNLPRLMILAQKADIVIEFVPQVGDFVAVNEPLFYLYGQAEGLQDRQLSSLVAFGTERTMEQDPLFAFRIEVDIALKALSPAINDPTTAVLAIDQLHRLLRYVGGRSLHSEEIQDTQGRPRVIFHTPNWEDFVHIALREIRHYGAGSLQIARRLRAMLESLLESLPVHRHEALRIELDLLDRMIANVHLYPEDLALARIPDSQGLGAGRARRATLATDQ